MGLLFWFVAVIAGVFAVIFATLQSFTHRITQAWTDSIGRSITGTNYAEYTGDSQVELDMVLANDTTQPALAALRASGLQSLYMKADIAATITFQDDSGDVGTVTLVANKPYIWNVDSSHSIPISGDTVGFNVSSGAAGNLYFRAVQNAGLTPLAALTGTFLTTPTEAEVVSGGQTIIITLTNATWVAAGATFDAIRAAIIEGLTATTSQAAGWNAEVKTEMVVTNVVRTSSTVVTITLPAVGDYSIASNETVVVTVPPSATSAVNPIVATPTITIVAA